VTQSGAGGTSISLAAWSVRENSKWPCHPRHDHFGDLDQLQRVLGENGVPAIVVRSLRQCSADWAPDHNEMLNFSPDAVPTASKPVAFPRRSRFDWKMEVNPAELPKGYELFIGPGTGPLAPRHPVAAPGRR